MKKIRDFFETITILSRPQGVTYSELAELLGCSHRTAVREIEYIYTIFDLEESLSNTGREKRFYLSEENVKNFTTVKMPNLNLSAAETTALILLWGKSKWLQDSTYQEHLRRAFNKIFTIDDYKLDQFKNLSNIMLLGESHNKNYANKELIIDDLIHAMVQKRRCDITYHSYHNDTRKSYCINPLHLFQRDGGLYFFTTINDYTDIRTLAVERIINLSIGESHFETPTDFEPQDFLDTTFNLSFGKQEEFKILFDKSQTLYISERNWAKEQKIEILDNGNIILWLRTSGRHDIKRWVLSYGADAELLEPESLRKEIADELITMSKRYN